SNLQRRRRSARPELQRVPIRSALHAGGGPRIIGWISRFWRKEAYRSGSVFARLLAPVTALPLCDPTECAMTTATKPTQGQVNGSATGEERPVTVPDFLAAKARGTRLTVLTAYDYTMARLLDAAGVDGLLVGDSLGMVVQGQETSLAVTLDEVIY